MRNDSHRAEQLAARLDDVLPPGTLNIYDTPNDPPEVRAAVRIARAPRPALTTDSRRQIERRIMARADGVFGARARFRSLQALRWAAAAGLIVFFAVALLLVVVGGEDRRAPQVTDPARVLHVIPSAPNTGVYISLDAVSAPALTETGSGSTSLFIMPGG